MFDGSEFRKMKPEERITAEYLASAYVGMEAAYEPDGNVPPDFVLHLHPTVIAIEVRRLNESYLPEREIVEQVENQKPERLEGLEQAQRRLSGHMEKVCLRVKKVADKPFYLHADLTGRDELDFDALTPAVLTVIYSTRNEDRFVTNHKGFSLEWNRFSSTKNQDAVVWGAYMDHDAGGWTGEVYERNIQAVIDEKSWKVEHNAKNPTKDGG